MNAAIDIGNTSVKMGLFEKNELKEVCLELGEIENLLGSRQISYSIISKTGSNHSIETKLNELAIPVVYLSYNIKLPFTIQYKTPDTLGPDRIAGTAAAKCQFPNDNVLKIDFGTCITYDFIDQANNYCGGAISPGMMMRFKALHNYTAKLPLVDPMHYKLFDLTGTDTATSILSGVINGIRHEVSGIINEYDSRFGNLKVVATGGDSGLFVSVLKSEIFARPFLVLEGLNQILNINL
jgi:type III pantothenate kinase